MIQESYCDIDHSSNKLTITIHKFITHVPVSSTQLIKINGQQIYSSTHYRYRNATVDFMHRYLDMLIPKDLKLGEFIPLALNMEWWVPPNFETLKFYKRTGEYKGGVVEPNKIYSPPFDAINQWIWLKVFEDVLKKNPNIPDDSVNYIPDTGRIKFCPIDNVEDRKLVFNISQAQVSKKLWKKYFNLKF